MMKSAQSELKIYVIVCIYKYTSSNASFLIERDNITTIFKADFYIWKILNLTIRNFVLTDYVCKVKIWRINMYFVKPVLFCSVFIRSVSPIHVSYYEHVLCLRILIELLKKYRIGTLAPMMITWRSYLAMVKKNLKYRSPQKK